MIGRPYATLRYVDEQDRKVVHSRWSERMNRRTDDPGYRDEWYYQQCGGCLHWLALGGHIGDDWGICSSASSPIDGVARFEHDGCEHFVEDPNGFGIMRG